uniref:Response regulator receiver and ANTAR domain protein n=1 Tax=uncultured bacterium contig00039 TaxID=1181527 RepID=A0A806K1K3_9BACT|nr:response regulator receiver and ANTAR domain protein [uncultured bacterium contig00039]
MINSALIVSCTKKSAFFFSEVLNAADIKHITTLQSAGEARRLLLEQEFDLIIVDAPLADESGEKFSRHIASKDLSQVILAVKSEIFGEVSSVCEEDGVLTISKPINTEFFWSALSLAKSANSRIKRMQAENAKLKQKIEDIRIIDRAKCQLIAYLNLTEQEAHRFIEKQAMDLRSTKRAIAEEILKTYAG